MENDNEKIAVDKSAPDYLNPGVNAKEVEPQQVVSIPVGDFTPEQIRLANEEKQKMYDEENQQRSEELISRSGLDKNQEAQLTPEAEDALRESMERAKSDVAKRQEEAAQRQEAAQAQQAEAFAQAQAPAQKPQAQQAQPAAKDEKRSLADKIMHPTKK